LYPTSQVTWAQVTQRNTDQGSVHVEFSIKPNDAAVSKLEAQARNVTENWIKQNADWYYDIPLPPDASAPAEKSVPKAIIAPSGIKP
jgi:hypothetical protein